MQKDGILLESGTNEVEILEFILGGQSFGVNVLKIQAIEQFDPARLTRLQLAHRAVIGTILFRDQCITLVDLGKHLESAAGVRTAKRAAGVGTGDDGDLDSKLVLVMEFNERKTAFLVDGVDRIHRISWRQISPLSPFLDTPDSKFTGSLNIKDNEILIVDMEKVVGEILPTDLKRHQVDVDENDPLRPQRAEAMIYLAEDSGIIRELLVQELGRGNYVKVRTFANGAECCQAISDLVARIRAEGGDLRDHLAGLVSDIEMPKMDGLALCRHCKETLGLKETPVILFSSLINEQIARKCETVGADSYLSKPQFGRLVEVLDELCLGAAVGAP
ncbi:MAG: chemotaxis protein CheV [Candidatus Krumholzibacteriia bacterium]